MYVIFYFGFFFNQVFNKLANSNPNCVEDEVYYHPSKMCSLQQGPGGSGLATVSKVTTQWCLAHTRSPISKD